MGAECARSNAMLYLVMIHHNSDVWNALPQKEKETIWSEGANRWQELVASGEGIVGEPLGDPRDARVIRSANGFPEVTDGPFVESKEQFVGFMILDVASEERALEIAKSWPEARHGSLEVRLIHGDNARQTRERLAATG
jgi:hypothetical protein